MKKLLFIGALAGLFFACSHGDGMVDKKKIDEDFKTRMVSLNDAAIDSFFANTDLSAEAVDYMKFLYAYMPLPDVMGYDPQFFADNVEATLRTRQEMPWGKDIPEKEFIHFVLPLRVNNEQLDSSRFVFYEELKERVNGLSIEDAILETNHWCHEKVTYQPSDGRTSSPLSSVNQAIGRCGEESTFTVAALRSIGIPARQVYTPRWAHTDDNHAWVEAYANGQWHFLGACEPEAVLDLGWFNEPASRGILMNTNVLGQYPGPEEILKETPVITTINVTPTYGPVADINVQVVDANGNPVEDATVNFSVYNYAEFYPVATKKSNSSGKATLKAGKGDMIAWAVKDGNYGFAKVNADNSDNVVVLDKTPAWEGEFDFIITPPAKSGQNVVVTDEQRAANQKRLSVEDSIRHAYTSTFLTAEQAAEFAKSWGTDKSKTVKILTQSRGNHGNLTSYLSSLNLEQRSTAINMLDAVSEKDRRDIQVMVVEDNVWNTLPAANVADSVWISYVLNPRVENEHLTPYKGMLRNYFGPSMQEQFASNPASIVDWVQANIVVDDTENPQMLRMTPAAVLRGMKADNRSRNIFFVSMARAMGVPAQIDPVTAEVLYMNPEGQWNKVAFGEVVEDISRKGNLQLAYTPAGRLENPQYYSNFSLARLINGAPRQLEYEEGAGVNEINRLNKPLDEDNYLLLSGQRLADGSVLAKGRIFHLYPDSTIVVPLEIVQDTTKVQVIGNLDAESLYHDMATDENKSILSTTGRGYYVLGIIGPNDEPTSHALNDISAVAKDLEATGREIILLFPNKDSADRFNFKTFDSLPSNVHFGIDSESGIASKIKESLNLTSSALPVFVVADSFNRIVFVAQGYTIGMGEKLLDVLHEVN